MVRTFAALGLALALLAPHAASAGQSDAAVLAKAATDKAVSLDLIRARLAFATDRNDGALRRDVLRLALDTMSEADSDDVRQARADATRPGAVVSPEVRAQAARIVAAERGIDAALAGILNADAPIALEAEAPDADRPTMVAGPMPLAVAAD